MYPIETSLAALTMLPPEGWLAPALVLLWLTLNVMIFPVIVHSFAPRKKPVALFAVSFFSSWLTLELSPHFFIILAVTGALAAAGGAFTSTLGIVAACLCVVNMLLLAAHWNRGRRTGRLMKQTLQEFAPEGKWPRVPRTKFFNPFSPSRPGVRVTKNVEFARLAGQSLKLDVFEPEEPATKPRPAVLQLHGGAWIIGDKREQGLPLLNHLATRGWVGFNANYRLSPGATFPDHLVDVKRALAWIREHADEYNIDTGFIAITGGSAGGHLAALAALTQNDPRYQPGFEEADTSVSAAVPFYGVYDFVDRLNLIGPIFRDRILEPVVMKRFFAEDPEAYHRASPIDVVSPDAPPFLVVHGDRDVLAPVEYARLFVDRLREVSSEPVLYAELGGAQHAFDVFMSPRTARAVAGTERFLHVIHQRYVDAAAPGAEAPAFVEDDGGGAVLTNADAS